MGIVGDNTYKGKNLYFKRKREKKKANREAAWLKKQGGTE